MTKDKLINQTNYFVDMIIVTLIIMVGNIRCDCNDMTYLVRENIGLAESHVWKGKAQTVEQCMQMCVRRTVCNSMNYDMLTRQCELNTGTVTTSETKTGENLVYAEVNWLPASIDPSCFSRPCGVDEICIPKPGGTSCSFFCMSAGRKVCPWPAVGLNGGRYVGDTNVLTCGHGFVGSDTATCLATGAWDKEMFCTAILNHPCFDDSLCSNISAVCRGGYCVCDITRQYDNSIHMCRKECGFPPVAINALVYINKTSARYECESGYFPTATSSNLSTKVCTYEGIWSPSDQYVCYTCSGAPPVIDGATLNGTFPDMTRTYTCGPDPIRQKFGTGDGTIRCLESGEWETTDFECFGLRQVPFTQKLLPVKPGLKTGYLEIFINGDWHNVCYEMWNWRGTKVACQQLGYSFGGSFHKDWYGLVNQKLEYIKTYRLDKLECSGNETGLDLCTYTVTDCGNHQNDMVITCYEIDVQAHTSVRLDPGPTVGHMFIELLQTERSLCANYWGRQETLVACRTIDPTWSGDESLSLTESNIQVWAAGFKCDGTEPTILFCRNNGWGYTDECNNGISIHCSRP